jgi:hypothetical protein
MREFCYFVKLIGTSSTFFVSCKKIAWYWNFLGSVKENTKKMKNKNTDFDSLITFCLSF